MTPPASPPADTSVDPVVAVGHQLTADLFVSVCAIGEPMFEVALAYLSDTKAATDIPALLCEEIGEPFEHGLAARRYAVSGDRRALHATVPRLLQ